LRHRGCLIAVAVVLAALAAVAVLVGPPLLREGRRALAPIRRLSSTQGEFERWESQHPWKDPDSPTLDEQRLVRFLALRKSVKRIDEEIQRRSEEQSADGKQPALRDVPGLLEGVSGLVSERTAAFEQAGMTPAEYAYVERLVYGKWLAPLHERGSDPAAREHAAAEIEAAATAERNVALAAGLRRVAAELRARRLPAPEGIPAEIGDLLSAHAREIEALSGPRLPHARHGGFRLGGH